MKCALNDIFTVYLIIHVINCALINRSDRFCHFVQVKKAVGLRSNCKFDFAPISICFVTKIALRQRHLHKR